jgi:CheY-like chemotaxis protein
MQLIERRILIYVGTTQDGLLASQVLRSAGLACTVVVGMQALMQELALGCGALVVAEEVIAGAAMHPIRIHVGQQPPWSDLPVRVLTLRGSISAQVQRAVESLGNVISAACKILVVDDNADAADTLEALLGIEGFSVAVAYDGEEALRAVHADPPAIVLMDIGMPRMDGYEAARRIRAQSQAIRLIALTGWGQELDRRKAEAAGFNTHFVKPVDIEQLLAAIKQA